MFLNKVNGVMKMNRKMKAEIILNTMKAVREHRGTERVISKFEDSERPDITFLP
jgi:hypothetical protein